MIVDDDPEHDWIDKIRRASASNEARQQTFLKLAGQVILMRLKLDFKDFKKFYFLLTRFKEKLALKQ